MAFWMIASWILATGRHWRFVFHDDGSLTARDSDDIQRILPSSRVILSQQSDREIRVILRGHPLCLRCRNLYFMSRKFFDVFAFSQGSKCLSLDTDVLFFRKPERILQWIESPDPGCLFLQDPKDTTLGEAKRAAEILGAKVTPRINAGIAAVPRGCIDLDVIETSLKNTKLLEADRWYIEQSLYALAASLYGGVELLPDSYVMSIAGESPVHSIARHYMGSVRHLFYSEGMTRVKSALSESGK